MVDITRSHTRRNAATVLATALALGLAGAATAAPVTEPPPAPTGVDAVVGYSSVRISWEPVSADPPVTGYEVLLQPGDHTVTVPPDATSATLRDLPEGEYTGHVAARNDVGASTTPVSLRIARPTLTVTVSDNGGNPNEHLFVEYSVAEPELHPSDHWLVLLDGVPLRRLHPRWDLLALLLPAGTHELAVAAVHELGDRVTSDPVTVVNRPTTTPLFPDVPVGSRHYATTFWTATMDIASGYRDGTFRPYRDITRGEMSAFLYRMDLHRNRYFEPPADPVYSDVPATEDSYHHTVSWLTERGIVGGYTDGTFRPYRPVSRAAMAAFLFRHAGIEDYEPPTASPFPDVPVDHPFFREISWLAEQEVTVGHLDGTYRPGGVVTRGEMAAFLSRYLPPRV